LRTLLLLHHCQYRARGRVSARKARDSACVRTTMVVPFFQCEMVLISEEKTGVTPYKQKAITVSLYHKLQRIISCKEKEPSKHAQKSEEEERMKRRELNTWHRSLYTEVSQQGPVPRRGSDCAHPHGWPRGHIIQIRVVGRGASVVVVRVVLWGCRDGCTVTLQQRCHLRRCRHRG
jgi:hypothetical protein